MKNKILSILLVLSMLMAMLSVMPVAASADSAVWDGSVANAFAGGNGTSGNPYLIANGAQLAYMAKQVNSGANNGSYRTAYYKLTADIVLNEGDAADWATTAPANTFTPIGIADNGTDDKGIGYDICRGTVDENEIEILFPFLNQLSEFAAVKKRSGIGRNTACGYDAEPIGSFNNGVVVIPLDSRKQLAESVLLLADIEELILSGKAHIRIDQKHLLADLGKGESEICGHRALANSTVGGGDRIDGSSLTVVGGIHYIGSESEEGLLDSKRGAFVYKLSPIMALTCFHLCFPLRFYFLCSRWGYHR